MSRIKAEKQGLSIFNYEDWDEMIDFLKNTLPKFELTFKKEIQEVNRMIKN